MSDKRLEKPVVKTLTIKLKTTYYTTSLYDLVQKALEPFGELIDFELSFFGKEQKEIICPECRQKVEVLYKPRAFCKAKQCAIQQVKDSVRKALERDPYHIPRHVGYLTEFCQYHCIHTAWEFHDWLQTEYEIVKRRNKAGKR